VPIRSTIVHTQADGEAVWLEAALDSDQFWVDPRRVLFGAQAFTVLARVSADGPAPARDFFGQIELLSRWMPDLPSALAGLEHIGKPAHSADTDETRQVLEALRSYAITRNVVEPSVVDAAFRGYADNPSAMGLDASFSVIDNSAAATLAPNDLMDLRRSIREVSGIDARGALLAETQPATPSASDSMSRALRAEVIAIYW
jgi:hypothetical protein